MKGNNMQKLTKRQQENEIIKAFKERMQESVKSFKNPIMREIYLNSIVLQTELIKAHKKMSKYVYTNFISILNELKEAN